MEYEQPRRRSSRHVVGTAGSGDGGPDGPKVASDQTERVERVTGIEPAFSAWEADVLPLNYTREGDSTLAALATAGATAG
jgi:hypothetical protein